MNTTSTKNSGFTIVELLIAMLLSGIVLVGIYNTFHFQQQSYALQRQVVAMEQNLRAGMQFMESEIRMAGLDPEGTADAGIVTPGTSPQNLIRFTMDTNLDGKINTVSGGEDIEYSHYQGADGVWKLGRKSPSSGDRQAVAEYIQALSFRYLDGNGNVTTKPSSVRSVVISMTAQTAKTTPTRTATLTTQIRCRNLGI